MSILTVLLYALVVMVALLLIGVILIQPAKSGGMGAAFGGVGESVFGAQAGSHLTKATVVMTALFFLVTLILATLIGHGAGKANTDGVVSALESSAAAVVVPVSQDQPSEPAPAAGNAQQDAQKN